MPTNMLDIARDGPAEQDLRRYFAEDGPQRYSGRRFEALGGGGDRPETRNVITAEDLVAVQMLSVRVPAEVAIDLLAGDLGRQITERLVDIDTGVELGTAQAAGSVADRSPADQAWTLLTRQHGVDFVIAGKLLARKRPALIPVYDGVISCQFGAPSKVWRKLHSRFAADDEKLRHELAGLRVRAGIPATVTLLRVLDVVLWMRHQGQHQKGRSCPGFGSVPLA